MKRLLNTAVAKLVISLVLLLHFGAVLIAAFGAGTHTHPAPVPLEMARDQVCDYLRVVKLDVPWHFYAPNPGVDSILYVRVGTQSGRVLWREWPGAAGSRFSESYVRRYGYVGMAAGLVPKAKGNTVTLTSRGEALLGSFTRRIAGAVSEELGPDDKPTSLSVYRISGDPMTPEMAHKGWRFGDLRLHDAICAGTFTPDGMRLKSVAPRIVPMETVVQRIIQSISRTPDESDRIPAAVRELLARHADWVEKPTDQLIAAIEAHWNEPYKTLRASTGDPTPKS